MLVRARPLLNSDDLFRVLNSNHVENLESIYKFENAFSKKIGVNECYATDQGRSALLIALKSIKINPGDEIIVQSLICTVVIDIILSLKGIPVLADSSKNDFNLAVSDVDKLITSKTKAIIVAHLYGIPADIEAMKQLAKKKSLYIIEDCAHTIVSKYKNVNVGTFGDLAFFSFNFDKPISTGNGGMLVVNNTDLSKNVQSILAKTKRVHHNEERIQLHAYFLQHYLSGDKSYKKFLPTSFAYDLINYNRFFFRMIDTVIVEKNKNIIEQHKDRIIKQQLKLKIVRKFNKSIIKYKSSPEHLLMNSLRSQIGLLGLKDLNSVEEKRKRNSNYFSEALKGQEFWGLPKISKSNQTTFLRYPILNRSSYSNKYIFKAAVKQGIELGNYNWPYPIHLQKPYRKLISHNRHLLKNSEYLTQHLIQLPTHYYVQEYHLKKIVHFLEQFS